MNVELFQQWVDTYYKKRGWSDLDIFIRVTFLFEEAGEVARSVRAIELGREDHDIVDTDLKAELASEIGDVLGNLMVIANHYDLSFEDIFKMHVDKLDARYEAYMNKQTLPTDEKK
ncbi:MazG nucleotide pyrophosphohydrolase domain-containing protein [Erysipelothrix aquatica]|uniref:MazG nucleotide pyrophosphohydrolase domain-containing protein n=1 Tax=Erysipelothrix aquatica TaxID=2683714 RepID=UPI001359B0F1|nr:MazG-like family protein [Erysipelothrix aquatica]